MGEEVAIPLVLVDEESREILQRVVDKTAMLVNLNIKVTHPIEGRAVDPHSFFCGSGSRWVSQCGFKVEKAPKDCSKMKIYGDGPNLLLKYLYK